MRAASSSQPASQFRRRLLLAIMLVICLITAVAVLVAQRRAEADVQVNLQSEFQSEIGYLLGLREARLTAIAERLRALAHSVRIRSALEENDVADLYLNGKVELRDVLEDPEAGAQAQGIGSMRATFFRFLNVKGELIPPPGDDKAASQGAWEKKLTLPQGSPEEQQVGYFLAAENGQPVIREIITTPLYTTDTAEVVGAIVLGFKPIALEEKQGGRDIKNGVWFENALYLPGIDEQSRARVAGEVAGDLRANPSGITNRTVQVGGVPHLLFWKILNPQSQYPAAYQVCLYPVGGAIERQRTVRWQIIGSGFALLLCGLVASHFVSARFSRPVEQLARDSAHHLQHRERAEAALEMTEQKYRAIYENAIEGIYVLDGDGRFVDANPALARIFGFESADQLLREVTQPAKELYADPQRFDELLSKARTDGTVSDMEVELVRKDRRRIWVSQNVRAVAGANGAPLHFEGTLEDITERKQARDALLVVNAELEKALADLKGTQKQVIQQERLRALGQMASGVAHDFNNALVPILGFSELLELNPAILADSKTSTKYLQIIQTAAKDASSVVARLREFYRSRDHREGFTSIRLETLIEQAVNLTQPKWKDQALANGATIEMKTIVEMMPPVTGEESALREVLTNLIFNAVDAMPSGGAITLRTQRLGESAVIEIADTGTGMSEEVRSRCLEPFYSTKGERGTGLGLSMVFGIMQRHSGTIDIRSEVGKGTTFVLTLPLDQSAVAGANAQSGPVAKIGSLRMLVVEDEPQVRELLSAALQADGHAVEMATHGVDGLKQFLDGTFDLVLTDKAMPGMSGDQLATAIKQIAPKMPVILLTGFGQFLNPEDYPDIDVLAPKPISIPALREAIAKALKVV